MAWDAADPLASVNLALEQVTVDTITFQHLNDGGSNDPGAGLWYMTDQGLRSGQAAGQPLADRVEAEALRCLTRGEAVEEHDVFRDVCAALPGPLTPGRGLVMACLTSYAVKDEAGLWRLRPEDAHEARSGEVQSIQAELRALAGRNGVDAEQVRGELPV